MNPFQQLILAFLLVFPIPLSTTLLAQAWFNTYGDENSQEATAVIRTSDAGYLTIGNTTVPIFNGFNTYLKIVKTDMFGIEEWTKIYSTPTQNVGDQLLGQDVIEITEGYVICGGIFFAPGTNPLQPAGEPSPMDEGVYLLRIDDLGNEVWSTSYNNFDLNAADEVFYVGYSLVEMPDESYVVTGGPTSEFGISFLPGRAFVLRANSSGDLIWAQQYGTASTSVGRKVIRPTINAGNTVIIAGSEEQPEFSQVFNSFLMRVNYLDAELTWWESYGGPNSEFGFDVVQLPDASFVLTGATTNQGAGELDPFLRCTDINGLERWRKTYGCNGIEDAQSLILTSDSCLVMAGSTWSQGNGGSDLLLTKTDMQGELIWQQTGGGYLDERGFDVLETFITKDYLIAGRTNSIGNGMEDFLLVRTNQEGEMISPPGEGRIIYVTEGDDTPPFDGTSWVNSFPNLQDALADAEKGDQIWVSQGIYKPSDGDNRAASFELKDGVSLYGGFLGNELSLDDRQEGLFPTILSGNVGNAFSFSDNSIHVVFAALITSPTVVDGFTIEAGYNDQEGGAGMYVSLYASSLQISNCIFRKNITAGRGGGLWWEMFQVFETPFAPFDSTYILEEQVKCYNIQDCLFEDNQAGAGGAMALTVEGEGGISFPDFFGYGDFPGFAMQLVTTVNNCIIRSNDATLGGGIYTSGDLFIIDSCIIENNNNEEAVILFNFKGGGVFCEDNGARIRDCIIRGNESSQGGGMAFRNASSIVERCFIGENMANQASGVLTDSSEVRVINSILYQNQIYDFQADGPGVEITCKRGNPEFINCTVYNDGIGPLESFFDSEDAVPVIRNSIFWGSDNFERVADPNDLPVVSYSIIPGGFTGTGNLAEDPLFADAMGGDLRLKDISPGINAGENTGVRDPDFLGNPRIVADTVDMGAIEFEGGNCERIVSIESQRPSCFGDSDGTLSVVLVPETTGLSYVWNTEDTTAMISGLPAGTYSVIVADTLGCIDTLTTVLEDPLLLQIVETDTSSIDCNGGENGSLTITTAGGTTPLSILWSNGDMDATAESLSAGPQSVLVTDANDCTTEMDYVLEEPEAITILAQTVNLSCNGINDGSINLVVDGGTPDYTYQWNTNDTTAMISGLSFGVYTATVSDANGCMIVDDYPVNGVLPISFTETIQNVSCKGGNDGAVSLSVSGGTPGYSFAWDTGAMTPDLSDLSAGIYNATITDNNDCSITLEVAVSEPDSLELVTTSSPETNNAADGTATTVPLGGTPPYSYMWNTDPVQTDSIALNLSAGTYTVSVTDANGCTVTDMVDVDMTTGLDLPVEIYGVRLLPNPVGDGRNSQLEISSTKSLSAKLTVLDLTGKLLSSRIISIHPGTQLEDLPAVAWPAGIYFIQLQVDQGRRTLKLVKL